jgi:hypothetical protein
MLSRLAGVVAALALLSAASVAWFHYRGYLLYYGDAEAHLNIARRVVDSRTPGLDQVGTAWLPLPHLAFSLLVKHDGLWRTGLAGTILSGASFVLAGTLLFAAARRAFDSVAAGITAAALFALNPNLLYLQSTAMTEAMFFACLAGVLYFSVLFRDSQSAWAAAAAGVFGLAGTLTRYEGWFLLPFVALYLLIVARRRKLRAAGLFLGIAGIGPLIWLGYNWWHFGRFLEFYDGYYSAKEIYRRGGQRHPADGNWGLAWVYFRTAARLCSGAPLAWIAVAGAAAALVSRVVWPLFLLAVPSAFYVWAAHSSGNPIHVPELWPGTYYNTRYGLAALPLMAFATAGLVAILPERLRPAAAVALVVAAISPWIIRPGPENWICWKESQVNSEARRKWTHEAAAYLKQNYRGGGIFTNFSDLTGIYREAGIPLRDTLYDGNSVYWDAPVARPDLFLHEEWAVDFRGGKVDAAILKFNRDKPIYECVKMIEGPDFPAVMIYKRHGRGPAP